MTNIALNTEIEQVSYSLGINIAGSLLNQGFEGLHVDALQAGLADALRGSSLRISPEQGEQLIQEYFQQLQARKHEKNILEGKAFLEANSAKEGITVLPSGLQYKILKEGNGKKPSINDTVTTHYHGTLINGTVFDSSVQRGKPASFPVNGVIQGWVEALQLMPTGSKWQLFVPSHLAYGSRGASELIGPHTTLIFEVELLSIQ
ncbi:MAG: FKBP-type peptidyl-prolyl cis-trans isomerase [Cytophagaceae bacterium]|jgi:FKBP-type peptidyl-prolyl cis-trans isomerase FklB|nr:FKBP-type peptidyl-prolyl cis-trans isomerase [Cytophagaceae bacterium]